MPTGGDFELRGSGANSTYVVGSSGVACAGQISAVVCMDSADHNYTTLSSDNLQLDGRVRARLEPSYPEQRDEH